jgi:hypothetical protein
MMRVKVNGLEQLEKSVDEALTLGIPHLRFALNLDQDEVLPGLSGEFLYRDQKAKVVQVNTQLLKQKINYIKHEWF